MNRRGFIQSFIGAAAMAMVPDDSDALHSLEHPFGMGLAPIKPEGASIPYDPGFTAEFPKALKEGLNKAFGEMYEELEPNDWLADDQDEEV